MKQLTLIACLLFLAALPALAETGAAGGAAPVLRFGVGARGFGLGGAYGVIADDATATYWNAAGLSELEAPMLSTMHSELFMGTTYDYIGWGTPLKNGALGISLLRLSTPGIILTGGDVSEASVSAAYIGYGIKMAGWNVGATLKSLWESLPQESGNASGSGWSFDVGVQKQLTENYRFGLVIQDILGSPISWSTGHHETIPVNYRIGFSYTREKLLLVVEAERAEDFSQGHMGAEFKVTDFLKLRGGFRGSDFTAGVGLTKGRVTVDYAYCGGELGNTHRMSLSYQFETK
jgi:hypothetical protein